MARVASNQWQIAVDGARLAGAFKIMAHAEDIRCGSLATLTL